MATAPTAIWYPTEGEMVDANVYTPLAFEKDLPCDPNGAPIQLLPTEENSIVAVVDMARRLSRDTSLRIGVAMPLKTREWFSAHPERINDAQEIYSLAHPEVGRGRKDVGGEIWIVVTTQDLIPAGAHFAFAQHYFPEQISVVSNARLKMRTDNVLIRSWEEDRTEKLLLRTIALQYYKTPRSSDPASLTYSPLLSADQLDPMPSTLNPPPRR